jgi:hypothetical protein
MMGGTMKTAPLFLAALLVLLFCPSTARGDSAPPEGSPAMPPQPASTSPITLTAGDLTATFADNEAFGPVHKQRYNGIASIVHPAATGGLFVPDYAGFNLEHLFGGELLEELFEPRLYPMILSQVDDKTVRLYQPPTPRSKVESVHLFRMAPSNCIDVTVTLTLQDLSAFKHGYAGAFWANYIDKPDNKAIRFWGTCPDKQDPHWVEAYSEEHGVKSAHTFFHETFEPYFAPNFNATLANHFSGNKYIEPFFFGLRGKMVYALFFDRTEGIRFSQSPTGGGNGNPAWDHYFIVRNPEIGKPYSYRARVLYKPFVSNEDVREEWKAWRAGVKSD